MSNNGNKHNKNLDKTPPAADKTDNGADKDVAGCPKPLNSFKCSLSENSISKHEKESRDKTPAVAKSWNCREMYDENGNSCNNVEKDLAMELDRMSISGQNDPTDDFMGNPNLLRARDSLEDLLKSEQGCSSDSAGLALGNKVPDSNKSSPALGESKKIKSVAKVLAWDPFDKVSRKKDSKRKKLNKKLDSARCGNSHIEPAIKHNSIDHKPGDELPPENSNNNEDVSNEISNFGYVYDYKFHPKSTKSVVFTNEVMVVYFNGETVISEAKEPLKRELEQQVRNKEMRKGHLLNTQDNCNICLF